MEQVTLLAERTSDQRLLAAQVPSMWRRMADGSPMQAQLRRCGRRRVRARQPVSEARVQRRRVGDGAKSAWWTPWSRRQPPTSIDEARRRVGLELIEHRRHGRQILLDPSLVNVRCSGNAATNTSYWLVVGPSMSCQAEQHPAARFRRPASPGGVFAPLRTVRSSSASAATCSVGTATSSRAVGPDDRNLAEAAGNEHARRRSTRS